MAETQNDIAIKAMGLLIERQSKPRTKKGPSPTKLGTIRHLDLCVSALPADARKAFQEQDFSEENLKILRPFLRSVNLFYQEKLPEGKVWPKEGGAKERARAEKRLAKAA